MPHSYHNLLTHLIFSTKDRLPLLAPEFRNELHAYVGGICRQLKAPALMIGGTVDHVHMLVRARPDLAISDLMRDVKANSSRWLHETRSNRFAWQHGFAAISVSESSKGRVIQYIEDQEKHHRKMSFQDELRAMLVKNGIVFDARYIWK